MKERPILFTPENAQKVHEGAKTQTRRILKSQPWKELGRIDGPAFFAPTKVNKRTGEEYPGDDVFGVYDYTGEWGCVCPFGRPGDRLWIREAFCLYGEEGSKKILYRGQCEEYKSLKPIWKPSIHMPRWACRTVVELTDIRVERVQDITEDGAKAEGIDVNKQHVAAFVVLWESINGKCSWALNPWVWVLTIKLVTEVGK